MGFPRITWNFFRIHLAFFSIHPLIWSVIFWAANGRYHVSYVDSLFLCFSAQTVTGLSTINLSTTTGFQQAILFFLMLTGDYSLVSWVMVMVRKHYFKRKCMHVLQKRKDSQTPTVWQAIKDAARGGPRRRDALEVHPETPAAAPSPDSEANAGKPEDEYVLPSNNTTLVPSQRPTHLLQSIQEHSSPNIDTYGAPLERFESPSNMSAISTPATDARGISFSAEHPHHRQYTRSGSMRPGTLRSRTLRRATLAPAEDPAGLTNVTGARERTPAHERQFGGFPGPVTITQRFMRAYAPETYRKLERKLTMVPEQRLHAADTGALEKEKQRAIAEAVEVRRSSESSSLHLSDVGEAMRDIHATVKSYIKSGTLWIGRNSLFHMDDLTEEQLEDIGGVEYGALGILAWLVPVYFVATQLICIIVFVIYLYVNHHYDSVFDSQPRLVPKAWFSAFQALSAYTGGGLSLVDAGFGPFLPASLLVIVLGWLVVAGNLLLPVFLRWTIAWMHHFAPRDSEERAALEFLLDHPRRCYMYLFPAYQSWFLVAVFLFLTALQWVGFIVLDIGLPVSESLPLGQRVLAGFFQTFGVRASGFAVVSMNALAPATKLLYLVMMYISAYPIAMSIRATNVYEERSLGVYTSEEEDANEPKGEVLSKYLGWHLRKQLAFDLWWLVVAMLIICIIERANIMEPSNDFWFNQFAVLFEIISAYATIGLSLGIPTENFSFAGALKTGSKLVLIAVMLRGRHRDLPVAIDRSILLPEEFSKTAPDAEGKHIVQRDEDLEIMSMHSQSSRPAGLVHDYLH